MRSFTNAAQLEAERVTVESPHEAVEQLVGD
jgi:hypothetical protein